MTLSIPDRPRRRGGFTLVEMLVVIGIILLIMAILLPGINRAYKVAVRSRMEADLQVIASALDAIRADFDQYPQVYTANHGADWLFNALIGPNGTGFRARVNGKVYGPYLPADRFKTNGVQILDRYSHPILYYPAKRGPGIDITRNGGYVSGSASMFNPNDNTAYADPISGQTPALTVAQFQILLGDTNNNGQIDPGETAAFVGNFILWSAGPDEHFGQSTNAALPVSPSNRCDDVTNYFRKEY